LRNFVGIFEADSSYRFALGKGLKLSAPDGDIEVFTRYIDVGVDIPLPGALQANFNYQQDVDFETAAQSMHGSAMQVFEAVALAANCSVGMAELLFVSEVTAGIAPRQFYQSSSKLSADTIPLTRVADGPASALFASALVSSSGMVGDRLRRATGQYNIALRYWRPETMALALVHFFIAAETLVDVARDRSGLTDVQLAELQRAAMKLKPFKDAQDSMRAAKNYARHKFIFHEDVETHRRANDASNGFEHGHMDFAEIKAAADDVTSATAQHIRRAILDFTEFDHEAREALLSTKFETPIKGDSVQYVSGFLTDTATDSNRFMLALNMSNVKVDHASYSDSTQQYEITRNASAAILQPISGPIRFGVRH
jgi:hypothetical protein